MASRCLEWRIFWTHLHSSKPNASCQGIPKEKWFRLKIFCSFFFFSTDGARSCFQQLLGGSCWRNIRHHPQHSCRCRKESNSSESLQKHFPLHHLFSSTFSFFLLESSDNCWKGTQVQLDDSSSSNDREGRRVLQFFVVIF